MSPEEYSKKALIFGILSIALCETIVLGIVFGALAQKNAKAFAEANGGVLAGRAKVGKILGLVGLITAIVVGAIYVICGIVVCGAAGATLINQ